MPAPIEVRKVPLHNVSDASELAKLIDDGVMEADRVIAVIGKTEGNGGVNDYTRIIADRAFREVLVAKGTRSMDEVKQIPIVWSGGTDGVISPHATIFATLPEDAVEKTDEPRLTVGYAMSERAAARGHRPHLDGREGRRGRAAAMEEAGITDPADVHYVQTKTPLLTIETIRDATSRGKTTYSTSRTARWTCPTGRRRSASRVALGEIEMPTQEQVMRDLSLFSSVASCSSGVELDRAQIVVVGNARGHGGSYRIGHSVMKDALDQDGIWDAIRNAGLDAARAPALHATSATGWSTCSSSARPTRPARSAAGATPCSTTPTCRGTGRSRPRRRRRPRR